MELPMRKIIRLRVLLFALILTLTFLFLFKSRSQGKTSLLSDYSSSKRLAIIVPFRDRFDELMSFVPYISQFLLQQQIENFEIFIINQSKNYRFNRAALANVGYLLAKNRSDYIAIHDVDLLPINMNLSYSYPENGPHHLSSPRYHPLYNYDKYFGGILLIRNEHFELVNGMSNRYYGWGMEDDEFYTRVKIANLTITRPENLSTGKEDTFLHLHYNRRRDKYKSKEQREASRRRDRITGLRDIKFSLSSTHNITFDNYYRCRVFNVELICDLKATPWCLTPKVQTEQARHLLSNSSSG